MDLNAVNEYKQPEEQQQDQEVLISPRAGAYGQIDSYSNTNIEDIENDDPRYIAEDLSDLPSHQEGPNPQFEYKDNVYYGIVWSIILHLVNIILQEAQLRKMTKISIKNHKTKSTPQILTNLKIHDVGTLLIGIKIFR